MPGPAATVGSMHVCPMLNPGTPPPPHVGGPVSGPGAPNILHNGKPAAVQGDMCTCMGPPDMIAMGHSSIFHNGKPAACQGDLTAHGGTITVGEPNIIHGFVSEPMTPSVMAENAIPFPEITPILKTLASLTGRRAQLNEAQSNQDTLRDGEEGAPRIYNLQWVKEEEVLREYGVVKEVTLRAQVQNMGDGETVSFKITKPSTNTPENENAEEQEQVVELSGTVQDKMVEVVWEIEDTTEEENQEN